MHLKRKSRKLTPLPPLDRRKMTHHILISSYRTQTRCHPLPDSRPMIPFVAPSNSPTERQCGCAPGHSVVAAGPIPEVRPPNAFSNGLTSLHVRSVRACLRPTRWLQPPPARKSQRKIRRPLELRHDGMTGRRDKMPRLGRPRKRAGKVAGGKPPLAHNMHLRSWTLGKAAPAVGPQGPTPWRFTTR